MAKAPRVTLARLILGMIVPGGLVALAAWQLYRLLRGCQHPQEMYDRDEQGRPTLRCRDCLATRANPLYSGGAPKFRSVNREPLAGAPRVLTGIERERDNVVTITDDALWPRRRK